MTADSHLLLIDGRTNVQFRDTHLSPPKTMTTKRITIFLFVLVCLSFTWASPMPVTKSEIAEWNSAKDGAVVLASDAKKWDVVKHAIQGTSAFKGDKQMEDDDVTLVDFNEGNVIFSDKEADAILDEIVNEIIRGLDGSDATVNAIVADSLKETDMGFWEWLWSDEPLCSTPEECALDDEDIAFIMVSVALLMTPLFTVLTIFIAQRRMRLLAQAQQAQQVQGIHYIAVPNSTNPHSEKEMTTSKYDFPAQIKL
jgi:hypothetical protein